MALLGLVPRHGHTRDVGGWRAEDGRGRGRGRGPGSGRASRGRAAAAEVALGRLLHRGRGCNGVHMGGLRGVARRRGLVANCVGGRVFTRALSDAQVVGVCGCRRSMRSALQTAPPRRRRMLARSRPFLRHLLSAGIQAAATKARQGPERAQQERASSVWRASLCARLGPLTLPGAVGGHGRSLMAPSPPLAHPQCARGRAIPMTAASCMCFRGQRSSQHLNTAHAPLSPPLGRGEGGGESHSVAHGVLELRRQCPLWRSAPEPLLAA